MKKPFLAGLPFDELKALLSDYPAFRSSQIYGWIISGAESFDDMKNLPVSLRKELAEKFALVPGRIVSDQRDPDGTLKLAILLEDGALIETVALEDAKNRKTACLSTQAGCPAACVFCKTGALGFRRDLSSAEITGQFLSLRKIEKDISHIVFMGMGEPLLNLEEVRKTCAYLGEKNGLDFSKRRITLSTCGIVEGILDLTEGGPDIRLALSLISAREELRQRLMPLSRENPLPRLKDALIAYQKKRKRRITLEIVLLAELNTGPSDAYAVAEFSRGLDSLINLIPWNHVPDLEFDSHSLASPSVKETLQFKANLEKFGLKVTLRRGKGGSISGACGQLGKV